MLPLCREEGIGVIPWSPLARGVLAAGRRTVNRAEGETARAKSDDYTTRLYEGADFAIADRVADLAREKGVSPARIALAWLLHQPGVTAPIVGATKMKHLEDAVGAVGVRLTAEERQRLEEPYRPRPVLGHQ